jgi:transcription antitermination factor NusG
MLPISAAAADSPRGSNRYSGRICSCALPSSGTPWTIGITQVLLNGERPAAIPDPYIDDLRAREGPDGLVRLPQARPEFMHGDQIRIMAGPLQNRFAIFAGMLPRERVAVLIAMLGSERLVDLDQRDIEPV